MEDYIQQRIGKTLGERWRLESVLGVGGMATVYAARDAGGQEVAVKVLHPEIGMRPEIRDRFMREGYVANKIGHPGVVQVLEHGAVDEWSVFLVMERLVGESLADRVARHGTLPTDELLDVLDQVLDVLAAAHGAGVVHRDLKPDNLFVLADGRIKVLDFGLARVLDGTPDDVRTRTGMAMGTMPYMAPEQALGKRSEIDGRVDLFALGATAFRILARRRIHESDSDAGLLVAMATAPAPPLGSVAPHVAESVAAIVDLSLAFNRDARYPDARSMQADVRAVRAGQRPEFALARRQTRDEPTRVGMAAPGSTGASSAAPLSAAPTVVARLDAPTVVARLDVPTVVARLDAPTVVAPQQPTAVGLGPSGPPLAAPPQGQAEPALPLVPAPASAPGEPLVSAVSLHGAPAPPSGGRRRGLWVAALVAGTACAGGASWWIVSSSPATGDVALDAAAASPGGEAVQAAVPVAGRTPEAAPGPGSGEVPRAAGRAGRVPVSAANVSSSLHAPAAPPAPSSPEARAASTAVAPSVPPAPAAEPKSERGLTERAEAPVAAGSEPARPTSAVSADASRAGVPASAETPRPAGEAERDGRKSRGKGGTRGHSSKADKGS